MLVELYCILITSMFTYCSCPHPVLLMLPASLLETPSSGMYLQFIIAHQHGPCPALKPKLEVFRGKPHQRKSHQIAHHHLLSVSTSIGVRLESSRSPERRHLQHHNDLMVSGSRHGKMSVRSSPASFHIAASLRRQLAAIHPDASCVDTAVWHSART